jgi:hypothetical protein
MSFSIVPSQLTEDGTSLVDDIRAKTGSDTATAAILRSMERFRGDPSILRYEISPQSTSRFGGVASSVAWTVRAIRS